MAKKRDFKMDFEDMISTLDEAYLKLVDVFGHPETKEARDMIMKVKLSLGEWTNELEELIEYKYMYEDLCK